MRVGWCCSFFLLVYLKFVVFYFREKFNINVYLVLGDCLFREIVKELEGFREI